MLRYIHLHVVLGMMTAMRGMHCGLVRAGCANDGCHTLQRQGGDQKPQQQGTKGTRHGER
jgi:hypothetical protein